MEAKLNKLARYKLLTELHRDTDTTIHTTYDCDIAKKQRRVEVKTKWEKDAMLGIGGFGNVWREKESSGELRAVKEIHKMLLKHQRVDFTRELELLVLVGDVNFPKIPHL